ncbi:hypothetical protein ACFU80_38200, partial [Streptomyces erythrochromogenes]
GDGRQDEGGGSGEGGGETSGHARAPRDGLAGGTAALPARRPTRPAPAPYTARTGDRRSADGRRAAGRRPTRRRPADR